MTNEQLAENDRNINNIEVYSTNATSLPTLPTDTNLNQSTESNCIKSLDDNKLSGDKCKKIVGDSKKVNKTSNECNEKTLDSICLCSGNGDNDDVTINGCCKKDDIDLVTIVTISGCTDSGEQQTNEMEILAHL